MKKKLSLKLFFLTAVLYFILAFFFVISLLHCINVFWEISSWNTIMISLRISLLISIVGSIIDSIVRHKQLLLEGKFGFWINQNCPKLLLGYIVLLFILLSITNHVIWTADEINDVLTIEWTIFGLSLTIFLVWNVIIVEYLRKKQPTASDSRDILKEYNLLRSKQFFAQEVDTTFSAVILLSINLVLLLFSSSAVYISHIPEEVFTQNLVSCTFFFSTGTISLLFFDILKPLKKDKESLKAENRVSRSQLDNALIGAIIQKLIDTEVQKINDSDELTDEEKKERIERCFDEWKSMIADTKTKQNPVKQD